MQQVNDESCKATESDIQETEISIPTILRGRAAGLKLPAERQSSTKVQIDIQNNIIIQTKEIQTEQVDDIEIQATAKRRKRVILNDSSSDEELSTNKTFTETLVENIKPQFTSIFDHEDEIDQVLDMNTALAHLSKTVIDPLFGTIEENQLPAKFGAQVISPPQNDFQEDQVLYDSDGNVIPGNYEDFSDAESYDAINTDIIANGSFDDVRRESAKLIRENELELPVRFGAFNMNQFLNDRGIRRLYKDEQLVDSEPLIDSQDITDPKQSQSPDLKGKSVLSYDVLPRDKSNETSPSKNLLERKKLPTMDSDDEEMFEIEIIKDIKPNINSKRKKVNEIFRLANEQAKLRRIQDEEYRTHLMEQQKRKRAARRAAKRSKNETNMEDEAGLNNDTPKADSNLKKLVKKSESITQDKNDSEKLNDILGEDLNIQEDSTVPNSENEIKIATLNHDLENDLPSSQACVISKETEDDNFSQKDLLDLHDSQSFSSSDEHEIETEEYIADEKVDIPERIDESIDDFGDDDSGTNAKINQPQKPFKSSLGLKSENNSKMGSMDFFLKKFSSNQKSTAQDDAIPFLSGTFDSYSNPNVESNLIFSKSSVDHDMLGFLSGKFDEDTISPSNNIQKSQEEEFSQSKFLVDSDEDVASEKTSNHILETNILEDDNASTIQDNMDVDSNLGDSSSNEDEEDDEVDETNSSVPQKIAEQIPENSSLNSFFDHISTKISALPTIPAKPQFKTKFVEEEAEVEDDEFMLFGGADGEIGPENDQYDPAFVGEADKEVIQDFSDIVELHRKQMKQRHETDVAQLLKDVTSGNLQKRFRRDASGKGLDDDSEEDDDEILRKLRSKTASAFVLDDGDDEDKTQLERLANNPRTMAFAKCFELNQDNKDGFISSSDHEQLDGFVKKWKMKSNSDEQSQNNEDSDSSESDYDKDDLSSFKKAKSITKYEPDDFPHKSLDDHVEINNENIQVETLASQRLGFDIFNQVRERQKKQIEAKRSRIVKKDNLQNLGIRTMESSRIYHKESFLSLTVKSAESTETKRAITKKNGAFQIGSKITTQSEIIEKKSSQTLKKKSTKNPLTELISRKKIK